MRMLALAQGWQDVGGRAVFLFAQANEAMSQRLEKELCAVTVLHEIPGSKGDAEATTRFLRTHPAAWVAVDGYNFDQAYLMTLTESKVPVLVMTDYPHAEKFPVAALLNQNPPVRTDEYAARAPGTSLLLGLQYVLLRREFRAWSQRRPLRSGRVSRLLVTMGGADPDNVTERVVSALKGVLPANIQVTIVVGAQNVHGAKVKRAAHEAGLNFQYLERVEDMPALLSECDLAVCAAGATCWELAFMGVPMLAVILAQNQEPLAAAVERLGCGVNLGWHHQLDATKAAQMTAGLVKDSARLAAMARCGQALVDGGGTERVVNFLRQYKDQLPS